MIPKLKIGIIGGSISGCCAAILLGRAGHDVHILERSESELQDRGAGILLPNDLIETLIKNDLVDADYPCFPVKSRDFITKDGSHDGKVVCSHPVNFKLNNWGLLFKHLRKRVPNSFYSAASNMESITEANNQVIVKLANGQTHSFDLVIGADGHLSQTRQHLFPEISLQYAGYAIWRGVIPESEVYIPKNSINNLLIVAHQKAGHGGLYPIPMREADSFKKERMINWIVYENISRERLNDILLDVHGRVHRTGMPPKTLREPIIKQLHDWVTEMYPPFFADIVKKTPYPFLQTVQDLTLTNYRKGKICLIGDASIVVRPHTGSGAVKGLWDSLFLVECLAKHTDLEEALSVWDKERTREGTELAQIGKDIGKHIQVNPPDWNSFNEPQEVVNWWNDILAGRKLYITSDK